MIRAALRIADALVAVARIYKHRFIAWAADLDRRGQAGEFGKWPWQKDYGLWPWQRRRKP